MPHKNIQYDDKEYELKIKRLQEQIEELEKNRKIPLNFL